MMNKDIVMKLSLVVLIVFCTVINPVLYAQQEKQIGQEKLRIAVLDFESIGGCREDFGKGVAEILRTALIKTDKYIVIERGMLYDLIEEQKLQLTGFVDVKTAVELGKITGADTVVIGSIVKFGPSYTITPRFIDVETAEAKVGENLTCNSEEDIPQMCNRIVAMIVGEDIIAKNDQPIFIESVQNGIIVDKSKNLLFLKKDGQVIKTYPVSTSKDTPLREYKVANKLENPVWFTENTAIPSGNPDNILGSRWIGLDIKGYGIHGTNDPNSIGKHSTKGCIAMLNEDIEELYTLVPIETSVVIINESQAQLPDLVLNAIIWDPTNSTVIINDKVLKVGDNIDGATLTDISKDQVSLMYKGDEIKLKLDKRNE